MSIMRNALVAVSNLRVKRPTRVQSQVTTYKRCSVPNLAAVGGERGRPGNPLRKVWEDPCHVLNLRKVNVNPVEFKNL